MNSGIKSQSLVIPLVDGGGIAFLRNRLRMLVKGVHQSRRTRFFLRDVSTLSRRRIDVLIESPLQSGEGKEQKMKKKKKKPSKLFYVDVTD